MVYELCKLIIDIVLLLVVGTVEIHHVGEELLASPAPGDRGANPNFPPPPLLPFAFPSSLPEAAAGQSHAAPVKGAAGSWCLPARQFWREAPLLEYGGRAWCEVGTAARLLACRR
jgi:hypothetical protein